VARPLCPSYAGPPVTPPHAPRLALLVRRGLEEGQLFPLEEGHRRCVLGRGKEADVRLLDDGVSRTHAELVFKGGVWILKDLGSTNGTFLNAIPARSESLAPRDLIGLGQAELLVVPYSPTLQEAGLPRAAPDQTEPKGTVKVRYAGPVRGESGGVKLLERMIQSMARTDATVLILGETGTGKELVARGIHSQSARCDGPFVAVNCGAIPETLVESELFGHEAGAFTGALGSRKGRFEEASGGTLCLDEIGDLPLKDQTKLLRVLDTKVIRRLGGSEDLRVDVRILAATHRDLEQAVSSGGFREDLFHRLRVGEIRVPSLRDRAEDIPRLVAHFLAALAPEHGRREIRVGAEAMRLLKGYPWPGNIRELRNVLERAALLLEGEEITPEALSFLSGPGPEGSRRGGRDVLPLEEYEAQMVLRHIERALLLARGNKAEAARMLGISRQTLYERMRRCGADPEGQES